MVEFFDGNTGEMVSQCPWQEWGDDERVVRVVKLAVDEAGQACPLEQAVRVTIHEYAEDGEILRSHTLKREATSGSGV